MQTASSAYLTCRQSASASEYTATEATPSSLQARITRMAISPRLAMRTLPNMHAPCRRSPDYSNRRAKAFRLQATLLPAAPYQTRRGADTYLETGKDYSPGTSARHLILSLSRAGLLRDINGPPASA